MIVYYRLCSIPSSNPSPIYQEDKYRLTKLCLKSFVKAFKKVKPEVVFIADYCGQEYYQLVEEIVPFKYSYIPTNFGINGTCLFQYEMAYQQDQDILFQECDYIYLPNTGEALVEGLNELKMVSPYDHLNFYIDKTLHSDQVILKLVNDTHWRSAERNTMTFAIKNEVFKKHYEIFKHYGYLDGDVWYDLLSKGQPLWVPIPGFATHMVKDYLTPSIDWSKQWKT